MGFRQGLAISQHSRKVLNEHVGFCRELAHEETGRMTKSSINREESLFDAARELADPVQRRAFLLEACGEDSALLERVENLLKAM
jgi:hypothetical protein